MRPSLGALPGLAAAAALGWLSWPYLAPTATPRPARPPVATIGVARLAVRSVPVPDRDPFRLPAEVAAAARASAATPVKVAAKSVPTAPRPQSKTSLTSLARRLAAAATASLARVRARQAEAESIRASLTLSATSILGDRRLAILNGAIVAEGETIGGLLVAQVRPESVLVRRGDLTVEVAFAPRSLASSSSSSGRPPPSTTRPAARAARRPARSP